MSEFLEFLVDGKEYTAMPGETIAGAMIRLGLMPFRRHPVDQSPRAPFCMMGICHECLVEIDGRPAQQACLKRIEPGMIINRFL